MSPDRRGPSLAEEFIDKTSYACRWYKTTIMSARIHTAVGISNVAFYTALQDTLRTLPAMATKNVQLPPFPARDLSSVDRLEETPVLLPAKPLANYLLSIFSQHCTDILYFVHQFTMLLHVEDIYATSEQTVVPKTPKDRWVLARMFAMLAIGALHSTTPALTINRSKQDRSDEVSLIPGMKFFVIAKGLLPIMSDCRGPDAVQTLVLLVRGFLDLACIH